MHEGALWEYVKKAFLVADWLAKGRQMAGLGLVAQRSAAATLAMSAANRGEQIDANRGLKNYRRIMCRRPC